MWHVNLTFSFFFVITREFSSACRTFTWFGEQVYKVACFQLLFLLKSNKRSMIMTTSSKLSKEFLRNLRLHLPLHRNRQRPGHSSSTSSPRALQRSDLPTTICSQSVHFPLSFPSVLGFILPLSSHRAGKMGKK